MFEIDSFLINKKKTFNIKMYNKKIYNSIIVNYIVSNYIDDFMQKKNNNNNLYKRTVNL